MAQQILAESAAPSTPATGYVAVYAKADGLVYSKDDAGTESLVSLPKIRFSAYSSTSPSITSGVFAKLPANTEEFDIGAMYDAATNYRFTPTVAGYYFFNVQITFNAASGMTRMLLALYKNGAAFKYGDDVVPFSATQGSAQVTALIYCNGTTDYVEAYGLAVGTTLTISGGAATSSFFQGFLTGL